MVLYGLAALAVLVSRFTQRNLDQTYKMPLWPLTPLMALLGCVAVIVQQSLADVAIVSVILLLVLQW